MQKLYSIEEIDFFLNGNDVAFLYISQPNCGVCLALLPKVEELLVQFTNIKPAYINALAIPEVAEKFSVFTVPVLLLFIDGKEMMRKARIVSMDELEYELDKMYQLYFS